MCISHRACDGKFKHEYIKQTYQWSENEVLKCPMPHKLTVNFRFEGKSNVEE